MTASSKNASRRELGRVLGGACHTFARTTPIALAALGVVFAGPASAESKLAPLGGTVFEELEAVADAFTPRPFALTSASSTEDDP